MQPSNSLKKQLPKINDKSFKRCALDLFKFQASANMVYARFLKYLNINIDHIGHLEDIPFLPIEFYKSEVIKTGTWKEQTVFKSSGTTESVRSQHYIRDLKEYHWLTQRNFEFFYGDMSGYIIAALLPSYIEQGDSSLIAMVDHFIHCTNNPFSGFVKNSGEIEDKLLQAIDQNKRLILLGVSYALLDLEWKNNPHHDCLIVMETGGMKGRRKEMTRGELHHHLTKKFQLDLIHSEYGMTELLSQVYSKGNGHFKCPPWVKVMMRDVNDPFHFLGPGKTGGINVIDLAAVNTCAFIETKDLGTLKDGTTFEVLGRMDNSDIRGCNLLMI